MKPIVVWLALSGVIVAQNAAQTAPLAAQAAKKLSISGRVVDEAGRGVPDVPVAVEMHSEMIGQLARETPRRKYGGYAPNAWFQTVRKQTRTRADGSYILSGLSAVPYDVRVNYRQGTVVAAGLEGLVAAAVQARPDAKQSVLAPDLILIPGALIEGTVLDRETGQPIPHIGLGCTGPQRPTTSGAMLSAITDAQGKFRFRVVPGLNSIAVNGRNSADDYEAYFQSRRASVVLEDGVSRQSDSWGLASVRLRVENGKNRAVTLILSKQKVQ